MHTASSTRSRTVPFLDLGRMNAGLKEDVLAAVSALIDRNEFGNGVEVEAFETAFAAYCETSFGVGLASGLDALRLALLAEGIGPGDEVIVPANTFVATFEAVTQAGARPVVVDVSRKTTTSTSAPQRPRSVRERAPSCPFISTVRWPTSSLCARSQRR